MSSRSYSETRSSQLRGPEEEQIVSSQIEELARLLLSTLKSLQQVTLSLGWIYTDAMYNESETYWERRCFLSLIECWTKGVEIFESFVSLGAAEGIVKHDPIITGAFLHSGYFLFPVTVSRRTNLAVDMVTLILQQLPRPSRSSDSPDIIKRLRT
jgi:hypothetical protein